MSRDYSMFKLDKANAPDDKACASPLIIERWKPSAQSLSPFQNAHMLQITIPYPLIQNSRNITKIPLSDDCYPCQYL